jgi:signal transduction histidine kinase
MDTLLTEQLTEALDAYRRVAAVSPPAAREDYLRLAAVVEKLCRAWTEGADAEAKLLTLAFSRQVSDSLSKQPPEFRALAECVRAIGKSLLDTVAPDTAAPNNSSKPTPLRGAA